MVNDSLPDIDIDLNDLEPTKKYSFSIAALLTCTHKHFNCLSKPKVLSLPDEYVYINNRGAVMETPPSCCHAANTAI